MGLLAGKMTLNNFTRQYYDNQIDPGIYFYGENRTQIKQLINQVYIDPLVPAPDPVRDNLAWFQLVSRVRKMNVSHNW